VSELQTTGNKSPTKRFTALERLTGWRKVSIGMWGPPTDPTVTGEQKVDMTKVLPVIQRIREEHDVKVTPVHLWVKCVGHMLAEYPDLNVMIRRRKFFTRSTADVFMQVAIFEGDGDLGGILMRSVNTKSILDIGREVAERAQRVRAHQDKELEKAKKSMMRLPGMMMPLAVRLTDILSNDLGINLSFIGVKPDGWGGAMVTNVGSFGLKQGFAPLVPAARVPAVFCLGMTHDVPMVIDGEVVARRAMSVSATFDHRVYDGMQIAKLQKYIVGRFENPEWMLEELGTGKT